MGMPRFELGSQAPKARILNQAILHPQLEILLTLENIKENSTEWKTFTHQNHLGNIMS